MKRQKRKYSRPLRPWNKPRLDAERSFSIEYGLKKKKELWRVEAILSDWRSRARELQGAHNKVEEQHLLEKLMKLGLLKEGATLDDVLALETIDLLNRRLQTLVFKKGLANTPVQARQFIVHGHIALDGKKARWPSTIVSADQNEKIGYYGKGKVKGVVAAAKEGKK